MERWLLFDEQGRWPVESEKTHDGCRALRWAIRNEERESSGSQHERTKRHIVGGVRVPGWVQERRATYAKLAT